MSASSSLQVDATREPIPFALPEQLNLLWAAARGEERGSVLENAFVGDATLSATERVQIYHRAYFGRQIEALAEVYPSVHAALGEAFGSLAVRFLRRFPSSTPQLERMGERFVAFLRDDCEGVHSELADDAERDWGRLCCLIAEDAPLEGTVAARAMLTWDAALRDPDFGTFVFHVHPSLRLHHQTAYVRTGHAVVAHTLQAQEAMALGRALAGECVEQVCASMGDVPTAAALIAKWMRTGWVCGLEREVTKEERR